MPYQSHSKTWANKKELFSGARVEEFEHIWFEKIALPAAHSMETSVRAPGNNYLRAWGKAKSCGLAHLPPVIASKEEALEPFQSLGWSRQDC